MSKGHIDIVAIDLKVCLVIAIVSDFEGRHHPDDVERNETKPAIGSGPQLRPGSDVETSCKTSIRVEGETIGLVSRTPRITYRNGRWTRVEGMMVAPISHIGITDLFWLFIVFTSLQPMLKQRMLEASRRRLITEISGSAVQESFCSRIARRP